MRWCRSCATSLTCPDMADSTTHLYDLDEDQGAIVERIEQEFDAASPAMTFGRNGKLCVGFTFAIFGGKKANGTQIPTVVANQQFNCSAFASSTAYLYVDADGIGTLTSTGPDDSPGPAVGLELIYTLTVGAGSVTGWVDHRTGGSGSGAAAQLSAIFSSITEVGNDILFVRASDGKQYLLGPFE